MADPNIATKKRREPRWPADTYAALTVKGLEGGNQAFGAVLDVSAGGLRVRTPQPPVKFTKVVVRIALGEVVHELPCRCARVQKVERGNFDVGLQFDATSEAAIAFIAAFQAKVKPA